MSTYSFKDIKATLTGPGGVVNFTNGSAKEGITISAVDDKNIMTGGADGSVMHSLQASEARLVTIRQLKTSPENAKLKNMYNFQTQSSLYHGKNVLVLTDPVRGDFITLSLGAFKKTPDNSYAGEGGTMEWTFDFGKCFEVLGTGTPEL